MWFPSDPLPTGSHGDQLKEIHSIRDGMIGGFYDIIQDYVNLFIIISLSIFVVACIFFFMTSAQ
jgi:hypothetical protein